MPLAATVTVDSTTWAALAFVLTVPVNRWLIGRGRGHAVVHGMHGAGHH